MKIVPMKVELLDHMGSDLSVVNAARVSFAKESSFERIEDGGNWIGEKLSDGDTKLINYLAKHNHWTPFGHASLQFRIKAPIFVARQLVKHQVGLVWNEVSRRYVDEEPEFWFPEVWRSRPEGSVKQGSGSEVVTKIEFGYYDYDIAVITKNTLSPVVALYNSMIDQGVAPEQARMILPQNMMTEWWWSGSLAAFVRVCKLRLDPHAQAETREIAEQINNLAEPLFPVAWKALLEN
jgi:thymidylate synthase (FAD)